MPTWDDDVRDLFAAPYWLAPDRREGVAHGWLECMTPYGLVLSDYGSVREYAVTIYEHLVTRAMPLTTDATERWPDAALDLLKTWIEEGCRQSAADPVTQGPALPERSPTPLLRVRRNVLDLSEQELAEYRARLEDIGATSMAADALWQQVAEIHADWCLHYQEAFLLWHRAHLLWFEGLVGLPIPYWNFMSPNATVDGSPEAGLPQPFKDVTYIHPRTGEERPNPLRFAIARGGRSKACAAAPTDGVDCRFVQRDPVLYTSGDDDRGARTAKLAMFGTFQQQVALALGWTVFSAPEGAPGMPWANIPAFVPPQPDYLYPNRTDFDGLYEQPHDNFHGWIGPDMADNAYTANDPMFWSLHANIDRVFEEWNRAHPAATFTAGFPLRPFIGPLASRLGLTEPDAYRFTTIGDMARDSRALGYDYEPPAEPDATGRPLAPATAAAVDADGEHLYVLFPDVRCILETYTIDVFVNLPDPTPAHMTDGNADHYVGRITRLGMGMEDDKGRCVPQGVTRVLDATHVARALGLAPDSSVELSLLVTHMPSGRVAPPEEYAQLPGFAPIHSWGTAMPAA
jgi:Common central domain of tyrosinase